MMNKMIDQSPLKLKIDLLVLVLDVVTLFAAKFIVVGFLMTHWGIRSNFNFVD